MKKLFTAAALIYAGLAAGQPEPTDMSTRLAWQKEPTTVFGLKLGEPVSADDIRPCGTDMSGAKIRFCRLDDTGIDVAGFPITWFRQGRLGRVEGVAVKLLVVALHADYGSIKQVLVERYGPPTTGMGFDVKTLSGATVSSEKLLWMGRSLAITLEEHVVDVDNTAITFDLVANPSSPAGQRSRQIKDEAAKL